MCFWCERIKNPDMYMPLKRPEPCKKERAYRKQLAAELKKFCDEDFPNGAFVKEWNGVEGGYIPEHQKGVPG